MGEQDAISGMTLEEQVDYWQERCFAEMDEKATLLNQLQAIRSILEANRLPPHCAHLPIAEWCAHHDEPYMVAGERPLCSSARRVGQHDAPSD